MARFTRVAAIILISISCLVGHAQPNGLPVRQCDCDCDCTDPNYSRSQYAAPFQRAEWDCKRYFGNDAALLSVETEAELAHLEVYLHNAGYLITEYYTGAVYNERTGKFQWKNGAEIDRSWFPWGPGQPKHESAAAKVVVSHQHENGVGIQFSTVTHTDSRRYICEI